MRGSRLLHILVLGAAGMVGTLVSLYEGMGEVDEAAKCFEGATEAPILRAAARFHARHGRWPQAAALPSVCSTKRQLEKQGGIYSGARAVF